MKHKLLPVSLFLMILICTSFVNVKAQDLEKHTWKNRILVFKTNHSSSELYQQQVKEFSNSAEELADRKFVLYKVIQEDFEMIDFTDSESIHSGIITGKSIEKILNAQESFEVILIGLDGGIKLRQNKLLKKEDLYGIVDAMPMRRSELNRKND